MILSKARNIVLGCLFIVFLILILLSFFAPVPVDGFDGKTLTKEQNAKELDSLKMKSLNFAEKDEVDKIIEKVQKYADSLKEIQKKTPLSRDIEKLKGLLGEID